MRVVFFVGDGLFAPVLDSQVLVPLRMLGREAPSLQRGLLVLSSLRHYRTLAFRQRALAVSHTVPGVRVDNRYRLMGGFPAEHLLWAGQLSRSLRFIGLRGPEPIVVHCRGEGTAAAAAVLKRHDSRIRILLDIRGDSGDEVAASGLMGAYLRRWSAFRRGLAMDAADAINTVSHRMARVLEERKSFRMDLPRGVIGCCVDPERFAFDPALRAQRRAELGLKDTFTLCYCGAMSHWQRPDAIAQLYAAVKAVSPDVHLLAITREAGLLLAELQKVGLDNRAVTVRSVAHDQVASYMMAADVGLLLRENSMTNLVASPVKFAEYLRCGLPVILTHYVGDYSSFVTQYNVGRSIEFPIQASEAVAAVMGVRSRLQAEGDAYRQRCCDVGGDHFGWPRQIRALLALYQRISE